MDIQEFIDNHSRVFREMPKVIPPTIYDHYHSIHLQPGSVPPNIRPYMYPYAQKSEIEHMVQEMLDAIIIQPRQSELYTPLVMVHEI